MNPRRGPGRRAAERGGIVIKLLVAGMLLAVVGAVYVLRGPLLRAVAEFFVVDQAPEPADAIIVLGDDNYLAERAARAAELYHARWAPRVVANGRFLRPYASVADLMRRDLLERGVPEKAIVYFPNRGSNTREEAQALRGLVKKQGWRRVLVVTSNYHTRRARYIFRHVFDPDVEMRMVAAPDSGFDPRFWWQSRGGWKRIFLESVGFTVAVLEINRQESPPGTSEAPATAPVHP